MHRQIASAPLNLYYLKLLKTNTYESRKNN